MHISTQSFKFTSKKHTIYTHGTNTASLTFWYITFPSSTNDSVYCGDSKFLHNKYQCFNYTLSAIDYSEGLETPKYTRDATYNIEFSCRMSWRIMSQHVIHHR